MTARLRVVGRSEPGPLRAVIYARTSKDRQRRGKSTSSQVEFCRREADARGWDVVEVVVDDDRSASEYARRGRDGWTAVVEMIDSGLADVLLMWEGSRATRALDVYVELEKTLRRRGVHLSYDGELYDLSKASDRRRARQDAVEAGYEADRTRERILRQKRSDAEDGWMGSMTPFGYRRVYDSGSGALIGQEPDPQSSSLVLWMVDCLLVQGMSPHAVATELNRRDELTPHEWRQVQRGKERPKTLGWTSKTVQQIVRGPAIAGLRQHRPVDGEPEALYQAAWPAIITAEEREAILAATYRHDRRTHNGNTPRHLLTWLARCGECGGPMRHASKAHGSIRYHAYSCGDRRCGRVYISQPPVDEYVARVAIEYLSAPANRAMIAGRQMPSRLRQDLALAARREADLREKKAELRRSFVTGALSAETLGEVSRHIDQELAEISMSRQPLPATDTATLVLANADDVEAAWDDLLIPDRRAVMRELFEILLHKKSTRGGHRFDSARVQVRRRG
ncbi:recombinase family protein [Isoptericola sp. NPDC056134]|uniref:recombinase family protein n=1 Tax=Isoptericola sp. NPDC056134 TaxID=3345723 RepID=UPI0035E582B5